MTWGSLMKEEKSGRGTCPMLACGRELGQVKLAIS